MANEKKSTSCSKKWPRVKDSALNGGKRLSCRPKPLASKAGVTTQRKKLY